MILPASPLSTLRCHPSRDRRQDSRPEWIRFSFSVGLSHPLQCAGLSRRSLSLRGSSAVPLRFQRTVAIQALHPSTGLLLIWIRPLSGSLGRLAVRTDPLFRTEQHLPLAAVGELDECQHRQCTKAGRLRQM